MLQVQNYCEEDPCPSEPWFARGEFTLDDSSLVSFERTAHQDLFSELLTNAFDGPIDFVSFPDFDEAIFEPGALSNKRKRDDSPCGEHIGKRMRYSSFEPLDISQSLELEDDIAAIEAEIAAIEEHQRHNPLLIVPSMAPTDLFIEYNLLHHQQPSLHVAAATMTVTAYDLYPLAALPSSHIHAASVTVPHNLHQQLDHHQQHQQHQQLNQRSASPTVTAATAATTTTTTTTNNFTNIANSPSNSLTTNTITPFLSSNTTTTCNATTPISPSPYSSSGPISPSSPSSAASCSLLSTSSPNTATKAKKPRRTKRVHSRREVLDAVSTFDRDEMKGVLRILYPNQLIIESDGCDLEAAISQLDATRYDQLRSYVNSLITQHNKVNITNQGSSSSSPPLSPDSPSNQTNVVTAYVSSPARRNSSSTSGNASTSAAKKRSSPTKRKTGTNSRRSRSPTSLSSSLSSLSSSLSSLSGVSNSGILSGAAATTATAPYSLSLSSSILLDCSNSSNAASSIGNNSIGGSSMTRVSAIFENEEVVTMKRVEDEDEYVDIDSFDS